MKRVLIFLFAFLALNMTVFAQDTNAQKVDNNGVIEVSDTSNRLKKEIKEAIAEVYGKDESENIYANVLFHAYKAIDERPKEFLDEDFARKSDWYKNEIIYMFYVDQFGVVSDEKKNTFKDTTQMLDYLSDLGVTALYMLPFADSPMKDAGFDVKDPKNIRRDLGGMVEFKDFVKEAKKRGFKIKADLVLNHFSDDHEWFKKLEAGDEKYLDYFIYRTSMPEYKRYQDEKLGTVAEYIEDDGTISKRRIIFPENTETNWREITVNNNKYYLYHTFYPFQLDINWMNPEVLYYVLDTISYWANLGIDIFRMDAIPYLSKDTGTNAENQPKTHAIIRLLSAYLQLTAPSSVIQVEACQAPKDILHYFGKDREVSIQIEDDIKTLKRTSEAQIAYHFPYMPAIWASLITGDKKYFIEANKKTPAIPKTATWGMFLRVHDELTLEMVSPEVREIVSSDIVKAKEKLAYEVTKFVRGESDANEALEATKSLFGSGTNLDNVPTYIMSKTAINVTPIVDILTESKLCASKSDSRRMIEGGGVTMNDNKVTDFRQTISLDDLKDGNYILLRKGKKNYMKVIFE